MVSIPEFHHDDVPPQQWLDELHSFNIPRAWDVQISTQQRINLAERSIVQLKQWRLGLSDQMKKIGKRYNANERDKKDQMLAPYKLLDSLGLDLYKQLQDLDSRVKAGRAVPTGFGIDEHIFGDLQTKRWHIGTQEDEYRWRDFLAVEQRYQSLRHEYKNQSRGYENAKQRVSETKAEVDTLNQQLRVRRGFSQIGIRLLIVMTVILLCLLLGISALVVPLPVTIALGQNVFAGVMLILALIGAIIAYQLARRRRFAIAQLEQDVVDMEIMLDDLTKEAKRQRQYILPTRRTLKEVKGDYEVLKATF
ncbi:MAG: hypothetical protein AAFV93_06020 [Chloroflexota bacterium]